MNKAILEAVTQFTELKSERNYKLSALVKLCEDHALYVSYTNITLCNGDFYDFLFSFTAEQLFDISAGTKTYNDF